MGLETNHVYYDVQRKESSPKSEIFTLNFYLTTVQNKKCIRNKEMRKRGKQKRKKGNGMEKNERGREWEREIERDISFGLSFCKDGQIPFFSISLGLIFLIRLSLKYKTHNSIRGEAKKM